ncbi:hypothetical protein Agub_g6253, partial [Astrephomene gubernaculifera]
MPPRAQPVEEPLFGAAAFPPQIVDTDEEDGASPGPREAPARGPAAAADGAPVAAPRRATKKRVAKLDLDLLKSKGGFNDIWHSMAPAFKSTFQGEGHETADLRRLLELYQRWQARFYPHCDFDTFVTKLEKAGRSRMVKTEMNKMRQRMLGLIFPSEAEAEAEEAEDAW